MKNFTDLFIHRPVLAAVVSLLILVLGLRALAGLPINQYPQTQNAIVTVGTTYYGADAATVAGFITQPLEAAIAQAQGIDYLSSNSITGQSVITATLRLNYDSNRALTDITTQVNSVRNQLPPQAQQPVLSVQIGQQIDSMYLGFYSGVMPSNDITDYLYRVVKPQLDSIEGVKNAEILGARLFALRAWLDSDRMAAHGVTAADVSAALASNNYLAALGSSKGQAVSVDLRAGTDLHSVDEFRNLVVAQRNGAIVRLRDVANVTLGAENYDFNVAFGGQASLFIGVKVAPEANLLDVARRVHQAFPAIQQKLPAGLNGKIAYDATEFVNASIDEVVKTLVEALLIVTAVIFVFLGRLRAVVIPVVAMPLSLIGTFFVMLALGYSINLLTLLALVLSIGLVVDDAIIVVENVDRHLKEGRGALESALIAARELGGPIVAMTVVLVAVYVPIGFQGGLTGALFTEFAFSLAGAVTVSGIIALTLSPMMCSRLFGASMGESRFAAFLDHQFDRVHRGYVRLLGSMLATWQVPVVMGLLLLGAVMYLYSTAKSELAPQEDQGIVLNQIIGAPDATAAQMLSYSKQVFDISRRLPEYYQMFQISGNPTINQGFGGVMFKPWNQRTRSAGEIQQQLQREWSSVAGAQVAAFQFPPLPGTSGLPLQFVIKTTEPFDRLNEVARTVVDKARKSGMFFYIDSDLKIDKPQSTLAVDRDMIALLGLNQQDVAGALTSALGGGYVNYFSISGRSYKVIPQVLQTDRLNPSQVLDYYIRTPGDAVVPVRTVGRLESQTVPETIAHFQQLNSVTIGGVYAPTVSQDQVLAFLREATRAAASDQYQIDYSGGTRQFVQESGGFAITLLFALIIVFLALAALFESFRDPVVILVSVPMALFGALFTMWLITSLNGILLYGFHISALNAYAQVSTLNIYTQVGLVTLMGLISKHGILIVQFANGLREQGKRKIEAVVEAAGVRLRPILMTTAAMVLGVVPLVIASGAGASGRRAMGLVIFTGMGIGTLFTLFVVPAMYAFLSGKHARHDPQQAGSGQPAEAIA
ncbi:MAG: efflux RND transporter permease subunit [Burkholderiaceae bacterium]|nr:efflux RND transporter permease subunit [Burkholderiaceae bacterium]